MAKREVKNIDGYEKELLSETERIELFISKHWVHVAIAALAAVAIGVAVYAVRKNNQEKITATQKIFASAKGEELKKAIAENSGVTGVDLARLRYAAELADKKDFNAAAENLKAVVDNTEADAQLRQTAALVLGGILEQANKIDDAVKVLSAAADNQAFSAGSKAQAGFQAARLMIAKGDTKSAQAMLQRLIARKSAVINDMEFATWISQCEQTLTALDNGDFAVVKKAAAKK